MKAYELLDSPEKWTTEYMARDTSGEECDPEAQEAVCWCLIGAIERCYPDPQEELLAYAKVQEALLERGENSVAFWNDKSERTWLEVHSLLRNLDI